MNYFSQENIELVADAVVWEDHDEGGEGMFQTTCGRFETSLDPMHGYMCLHVDGDTSESIHEGMSLTAMSTTIARFLLKERSDAAARAQNPDDKNIAAHKMLQAAEV